MPNQLKEEGRNYIVSSISAIFVILIVKMLWPSVIPYGAFEFWAVRGTPADWLASCWPFLVWAFVLNILYASFIGAVGDPDPREYVKGAPTVFLLAALEELAFRWLLFLSAIVGVKVVNFLFFGFLGFGITEWLFLHVFGPIANYATLKQLEPQLFGAGWAVGAALLSTNAFFRNGHAYQGPVGIVNSWFLGMFMVWMTFKYGLVASIAFHFANNMTARLAALCLGYVHRGRR
jgi:hypothetical protein